MPYKPENAKHVEGVVKEAFNEGDSLRFSLKNLSVPFYLRREGARVDSGDNVRVYLTGRTLLNEPFNEVVRALEILDEKNHVRFTYISRAGPADNLGAWEWDKN